MKSNLRETLAAPIFSEVTDTSGPVWIGVVLGLLAAILYSLKAVFVKLAYLPSGEVTEQVPPITLMMVLFPRISRDSPLGLEANGAKANLQTNWDGHDDRRYGLLPLRIVGFHGPAIYHGAVRAALALYLSGLCHFAWSVVFWGTVDRAGHSVGYIGLRRACCRFSWRGYYRKFESFVGQCLGFGLRFRVCALPAPRQKLYRFYWSEALYMPCDAGGRDRNFFTLYNQRNAVRWGYGCIGFACKDILDWINHRGFFYLDS